jgi:serine/threonine protein phosphatase PrpC
MLCRLIRAIKMPKIHCNVYDGQLARTNVIEEAGMRLFAPYKISIVFLVGSISAFLVSMLCSAPAYAASFQPPPEFVAYGQLAITRLVVTYYAETQSDNQTTLTPVPVACTGLGTVIATHTFEGMDTGSTHTYILTAAQIVDPSQPCAGVINSYQAQYHEMPTNWRLSQIHAYLNTAYAGDTPDLAEDSLAVVTGVIPTLGSATGPALLELANEPTTDLPVLPVAPHSLHGTSAILDLGNSASDSLTLPDVATVLTPHVVKTVSAESAGQLGSLLSTTSITSGAPVLTDLGQGLSALTGLVIMTASGRSIIDLSAIETLTHQVGIISQAGNCSAHWHSGLHAFYHTSETTPHDPLFTAATQEFMYLQNTYVTFHGITPWLAAARSGTFPGATPSSSLSLFGHVLGSTSAYLAIGGAIIVLLIGLSLVGWSLTGGMRRREQEEEAAVTFAAEDDADADGEFTEHRTAERTAMVLSRKHQALTRQHTTPLPRNRRALRLGLHAAARTDPGIRRRKDPNQDNVLAVAGARMHEGATQSFGLFVVADGMGGHQFGREASMHAIEVILEHSLQPLLDGKPMDEEEILQLLKIGIEKANRALHNRNMKKHADMGTTVTAVLVTGDIAHVVNVGDSRTYHLASDLPLRQVTTDHSVVASLVSAGVIRPEDIYTHPKRNQIYRSLGEGEEIQVDTFNVILQPGDYLLLCSDGLWEMVRDPRIEEILRQADSPHEATNMLIEEANQNGGVDNISVVVIGILDEHATPNQTGVNIIASPDIVGKQS